MTEELIQTRLNELKQQQKFLEGNLNAIGGAIQDCEYWLTKLKEQQNAAEKIDQ
jgi:hypothetical protein